MNYHNIMTLTYVYNIPAINRKCMSDWVKPTKHKKWPCIMYSFHRYDISGIYNSPSVKLFTSLWHCIDCPGRLDWDTSSLPWYKSIVTGWHLPMTDLSPGHAAEKLITRHIQRNVSNDSQQNPPCQNVTYKLPSDPEKVHYIFILTPVRLT